MIEIVDLCNKEGLKEPEFIQEEMFRTIIWRKSRPEQVTTEVTTEVRKLLQILVGEETRKELQKKLELRNDEHFRKAYIVPALEAGLIEYTIPDKPNSRLQKYRLTEKGKKVLKNKNSEKN